MMLSNRSTNRIAEQPTDGHLLVRAQWFPTIAVLIAMALLAERLSPVLRLSLASVALYGTFKFAAAIKQRELWPLISIEGWLWYVTIWPGMDLRPFAVRGGVGTEPQVDPQWLRRGLGGIVTGAAILLGAVISNVGDAIGGWLTVASLLAMVHFGYADVLSWAARRRGFAVRRLFVAPAAAKTLNDFWTRRWNRAFVEMDQILFMPALRRHAGKWAPAAMLGLSGVLHELALSYPAGAGWGLPMLYFVGHGSAMHLERTRAFERLPSQLTQWWTRIWVLAPVSLVFHGPFREALPLQLLHTLKGLS